MPMIWNAQTDAQLLVAIIQVYDVKVSGEKLNEVAKMMGEGCTAKALTHRISKIKNMAKNGPSEGADGAAEKTKKAPAAAKGGKKAKKADTPVEEDDEEEVEVKVKKAPAKRKKGKSEDVEGDEEGEAKKIKVDEEDAF